MDGFDDDEGDQDRVCCLRMRYRRHKRGALASQVLVPRKALAVWFDFGAALLTVVELMAVPDTALALMSAVASVLLFEEYGRGMSANVSWTAVSFLIVFPLQNALREAYKRREAALQALVDFRAVALNIYLANAVWDWPGAETYNGRAEDNRPREEGGVGLKKRPCNVALPASHGENVLSLLMRILDGLQDLLLVPRAGHARMDFCCSKKEGKQVRSAQFQGREVLIKLIGRLHQATEALKAAGMPANEASRINQYNMFLMRDFERLWSAKTYQTPIALRAVLRVIIQFLPFLYGPYWLHILRGDDGLYGPGAIVYACIFSSMISLLLIAMANLQEQMENPFRHRCRDCIRVMEEINLARSALRTARDDIGAAWQEKLLFDWEIVGTCSDSDSGDDIFVECC